MKGYGVCSGNMRIAFTSETVVVVSRTVRGKVYWLCDRETGKKRRFRSIMAGNKAAIRARKEDKYWKIL